LARQGVPLASLCVINMQGQIAARASNRSTDQPVRAAAAKTCARPDAPRSPL